jgi:succinate dehydrogenase / fumarate reductase flavoprotein subunit
MDGEENPYRIHAELGATMLLDVTIERHNDKLDAVLAKIEELDARTRKAGVTDTSSNANQGAAFIRHLQNMIVLARVIAQGARNRDESRGAHFKPGFKERDDTNWLRTTMAMHKSGGGKAGHDAVDYVRELDYSLAGQRIHVTDAIDVSLVQPRARKYETAGAASAAATGGIKKGDDTKPAPQKTTA